MPQFGPARLLKLFNLSSIKNAFEADIVTLTSLGLEEDLAKAFAEDEKNQEYVQKFNQTLREMQTAKNPETDASESTMTENSEAEIKWLPSKLV